MSETVIEWSFAITLLVIAVSVPVNASAEETKIRVGAIDAVLTVPPDVERPPVALLIAGSGPTDRDGNRDAEEALGATRRAQNSDASL